jgi:hypothetical protein
MSEEKKEYRELKKRKHVSHSITIKRKTGCGNMYCDFNYNTEDFTINRVLARLGKSGSCRAHYSEAMGELISLLFQGGYDPEIIIDRLIGIRCGTEYFVEKDSPDNSHSCSDAIGKALKEALEIMEEKKQEQEEKEAKKEKEEKDSKKEDKKG